MHYALSLRACLLGFHNMRYCEHASVPCFYSNLWAQIIILNKIFLVIFRDLNQGRWCIAGLVYAGPGVARCSGNVGWVEPPGKWLKGVLAHFVQTKILHLNNEIIIKIIKIIKFVMLFWPFRNFFVVDVRELKTIKGKSVSERLVYVYIHLLFYSHLTLARTLSQLSILSENSQTASLASN